MDDISPLTPQHGAELSNIVTWLCLIIAFFASAARFALKWSVGAKFGLDDSFAIIAFVFALCSGAAVTIEAVKGMGKPIEDISAKDLQVQFLSAYVGRLCFLGVLTFAKLSIVAFVRHVSPVSLHHRLSWALGGFVFLLWVAESIAIGLQCIPPRPWDLFHNHHCINRAVLWDFIGAMNIVTDLLLVVLGFLVTKDLHMDCKKKMIVLSCFGTRLIDVAATGVQISYTSSYAGPSPHPMMWMWVMSTQIVQCVTICTSCIPYLRGLLTKLPARMYLSDEVRRRGVDSKDHTLVNVSYALRCLNPESTTIERYVKHKSSTPSQRVSTATSAMTGIFTRIEITHHDGESAEHINAVLSRAITTSTAEPERRSIVSELASTCRERDDTSTIGTAM